MTGSRIRWFWAAALALTACAPQELAFFARTTPSTAGLHSETPPEPTLGSGQGDAEPSRSGAADEAGIGSPPGAQSPEAAPRQAIDDEAVDDEEGAHEPAVAAVSTPLFGPEPPSPEGPDGSPPFLPGSGLLQLPNEHALDTLYAALARTEAREPGAITRIMHMGDSSIGLDQFPNMLRTHFRRRFGGAGAGFVLVQPHSGNYRNALMELSVTSPWDYCFIIRRCRRDGHYGLGGVTFRNHGSSQSRLRTRRHGPGSSVTHFELWYAAQPGGGRVLVQIDRQEPELLETDAEQLEDRWKSWELEPGRHAFRIRAAGGGPVRVYGAVMEDEGPGVVWDTLSMIGAFMRRLLGYDAEHFARQIEQRNPDALFLNYGGNDMRRLAMSRVSFEGFEREIRDVIHLLRASRPELPCLLVGINDRSHSGQQEIEDWLMHRAVQTQREAAFGEGCGYFDTYRAMGGQGSYERWVQQGLVSRDGVHLTFDGRQIIARLLYAELMAGYEQWTAAHQRALVPETEHALRAADTLPPPS
ncbi:MAG: hypothetical protein OEY14_02330 [Myxococcales bacterium]|nr:hypothetical protein [Myxococcales bacterium]